MMEKANKPSVLRAGIWYTVSNILVKGLSFITTPIFTRLLTKAEVGMTTNVASWVSILTTLVTLDLHSSVMMARYDYGKDLDGFLSSITVLGTLFTALCYTIVCCFYDFFDSIFLMPSYAVHMIFIYMMVSPAMNILLAKYRVCVQYRESIWVSVCSAVLTTGVSLALVFTMPDRLMGRLAGLYGTNITLCLILYIYILVKGRKISIQHWGYALAIALPTVVHRSASAVLGSSDRIMIVNYIGVEAGAVYNIAYSYGAVVNLVWYSLNQAWAPWSIELMRNEQYKKLRGAAKPYLVFCGIIMVFAMFLGPEALLVLGGEAYLEAKYVIPPVMAGYIFVVAYSLYANTEYFKKKNTWIARGTIIAAITNIVLNFICIPRFGYVAAAYTTLASYIVLYIMHFCNVRRLKLTQMYDTKFNYIYLGVMLVVMFCMTALYRVDWLRYVCLGMYTLSLSIFLIKRKNSILSGIRGYGENNM